MAARAGAKVCQGGLRVPTARTHPVDVEQGSRPSTNPRGIDAGSPTSGTARRPPWRTAALVWIGALAASAASTADMPPWPARNRFLHLTVEDGLSQNTVRATLQDRTGFLWFATEEGLNRFDGHDFAVFRRDPARAGTLPSDMVTALCEDRAGRLWVAALGGVGIFDRRTETFELRLSTQREVMAMLEDSRGSLWIATNGEGLHRLDPGASRAVRYLRREGDPRSLAHDSVFALLEDRSGRVWIGTYGGGLNRFDPESDGFRRYAHDPGDPRSLGHDEIWSLAEDASGAIWAGTNGAGVSVLDPSRDVFRHLRPRPGDARSLRGTLATALYRDRAGTLWVGTDLGLNRFVPEHGSFVAHVHDPDDGESLGRNSVRSIYEDVQGNLWVGAFSSGLSVSRRRGRPFVHYTHTKDPTSLGDSAVAAFLEDREGRLWVSAAEGAFHRFDPASGTFVRYRHEGGALTLHQDRRGRIWIGTWGNGLIRFDPGSGRFTPYRHDGDDPDTRLDDQVWDIHEDPAGALWLATDGGIFQVDVDRGTVTRYRHDPADPRSLGHDQARAFLPEPGGDLWVATLGGLDRLDVAAGTFVHHRNRPADPRSLSHDWAIALHRDGGGRLWVGTFGGGLNLLDAETGTFTAYKEPDGLPSNVVYAILEDARGRLWLSTNKGLCRFDATTKAVERYDLSNGLQSLQFQLGAALRTTAGRMLFGSWRGFYDFDPESVQPDPFVPPVVLTALKVFSQPRRTPVALPLAQEIVLPYRENVFSLEFAVLDYTFPRRNSYAYKLEGFNDAWIPLGPKRDVSFTNLDPGRYLFRVKGSNSDGVWDEQGTSLRIVITPPFWATWWWRTLSGVAFVGILFALHRYRVRHLERRERELQSRVDEALSRVRVLRGLLPICAWCKKVRDDRGYWSQIESYVSQHSHAEFTHGLCPECAEKMYPAYGHASRHKRQG